MKRLQLLLENEEKILADIREEQDQVKERIAREVVYSSNLAQTERDLIDSIDRLRKAIGDAE